MTYTAVVVVGAVTSLRWPRVTDTRIELSQRQGNNEARERGSYQHKNTVFFALLVVMRAIAVSRTQDVTAYTERWGLVEGMGLYGGGSGVGGIGEVSIVTLSFVPALMLSGRVAVCYGYRYAGGWL